MSVIGLGDQIRVKGTRCREQMGRCGSSPEILLRGEQVDKKIERDFLLKVKGRAKNGLSFGR